MALSNAERQKRFREKRNALAKAALAAPSREEVAALAARVAGLEAEVERLRADLAERAEPVVAVPAPVEAPKRGRAKPQAAVPQTDFGF